MSEKIVRTCSKSFASDRRLFCADDEEKFSPDMQLSGKISPKSDVLKEPRDEVKAGSLPCEDLGRVLIISGPTASGKSNLAIKLADLRDIAIINADSLQIYRSLPILSSQPGKEDQKAVPHFLYSVLKPDESSSVMSWLKLVKSTVEELWQKNKLPVIVGGSGMYIAKLIDGISEIPEISAEVKNEAKNLYEKIGHEEFKKKFGEEKIIDKQRLIRAYEVLKQTGKPISFWQQQTKNIFPEADFFHINLNPDRQELYKNCNLRFEKMLELGALEEVQTLMDQGAKDHWQICKTLGFFEIRDFLAKKINCEEMVRIATQKTRNYAKRQLTWFRNQSSGKYVFNDSNAALTFLKNEI